MKKALSLVLVFVLMLFLPSCKNEKQDEKISAAVAALKSYWTDFYSREEDRAWETDGYFEIKNTRVIHIKENDTKEFRDVDCIIEFMLLTDYFGTAPYYMNFFMYDSVVVYRDGTMEVQSNPIANYRTTHYVLDFSDFIGSIEDLGGQYNCIEKLK